MPEQDGRGRVRASLAPRLSRAQVVVGVLLGLVGFGAVTQVHATDSDTAYAGASRQDLVLLLDSLESAAQRASAQIAELQETRRALVSSTGREQAAVTRARAELRVLGILAGTSPATGPGVRITIHDPSGAIGSSTLLNALEELRDAGAEAVEIDDTVRVVARTALTDTTDGIAVDGQTLQPPYLIEAIGSPQTLSAAVIFPGGLRDEVSALGGTVRIEPAPELEITSLHTPEPPQYASPSPGGG